MSLKLYLLQNSLINNCLTNCSFHGMCVYSNLTNLVCVCNQNYTGSTCSISLNACATNPCINGGSCVTKYATDNTTSSLAYSFECQCSKSYTGVYCQTPVNQCINETCSGHGSCMLSRINQTDLDAYCKCFYLYAGKKCETASTKLVIIRAVVSTSSIIAIIVIVSLYGLMMLLDAERLYTHLFDAKPPIKKDSEATRIKLNYVP